MDLNTLWFILIAVLFIGFFFLEGFDYGVGILLPFLGKNDEERRMIINTIGPFWDGNEVWMITAGGAIFAAFPNWYATLFSGFYIALFLLLAALIVRAVSFEYRSKVESPTWRSLWDWAIFFGSLIPAILWGVAVANLVHGTPIDENMQFVGNFFDLLSPFTLLGGLATLSAFILHGAYFLTLKTGSPIMERAKATAQKMWIPTIVLAGLFLIWMSFSSGKILSIVATVLAAVALIVSGLRSKQGRDGCAFGWMGATIAFFTISVFAALYPNVMVSSIDPAYNLTIYNASSSPYTLKVMTIVAVIFVPIVLVYQGWTYYTFRQRITRDVELEY